MRVIGAFSNRALPTILLAVSLCPAFAYAEDAESDGTEKIVVKGQSVVAATTAWSTTELNNEKIRSEAFPAFDQLLRHVPGMAVRDFGMGGVANGIVIRGFGNGGHGGDLGAIIDGIPLNEAMSHDDGYVDLNVLIPLEVERLTVFRGPVSALYGNYNRGGLLRIETRKGGNYINLDGGFGAFSTGDLQVAMGRSWGGGRLNMAGQYYLTDGWRPNSDQARQTLSARLALDVAPNVELAVSTRYHHADSNSASYLTADQFSYDQDGIDPKAQNDGAIKNFATLRGDLSVAINNSLSLVSFVYGTKQDFTRWFSRPVNTEEWRQREETYDRSTFGAGISLNGTIETGFIKKPVSYVFGAEVFREKTNYIYFDDLDNRRRINTAINDRQTRLNSVSAFSEIQVPFRSFFDVSFGLRADHFTGGCNNVVITISDNLCGRLNTIDRVSPKVGLQFQFNDFIKLRSSWAKGFALPNAYIKYALSAQSLDPNVFIQTELGATFKLFAGLNIDIAAFVLKSSNEIRTVASGIYENYGSTRRNGIETSSEWHITPTLKLRSVYSYTKTKVTKNDNFYLIGKSVAGVPKHSANVDVNWTLPQGWSVAANWRYVGDYNIDAGNLKQAKAYDLFDLTLSYESTLPFSYRLYVRMDNLADKKYVTSASVIGGQTLVAPGQPRALRAGMQVSL